MEKPNTPINEQNRLDALNSYEILDTADEQEYNDIVEIASQICETNIALISLIDKNRQWFKSNIGLNATETSRDISFCGHAINLPDDIFLVPDARLDKRFSDNPLVTGEPNIVFYAGAPLVDDDGFALGTICVLDSAPKKLNEKQINALKILSRQVIQRLNAKKKNLDLIKEKSFFIDSINFACPFFLLIDINDFVIGFGDNYKISVPDIKKGKSFSDFFIFESGYTVNTLLTSNLYENKLLFYKSTDGTQRYKCSIKKYDDDALLILSVPVINSNYLISSYSLKISNFPRHDYIAEYLFLQQAATKGLQDSKIMSANLTEKNKLLELSKSALINANGRLEEQVNERTKKIKNLALFPEQNPNPVFELDYENKVINYSNPASKLLFYKNQNLTFEELIILLFITEEAISSKKSHKHEIEIESKFYERYAFFIEGSSILRIYLHNITEIRNFQNELKEKNLKLEATLSKVVNLQDDIIKKEKMATLGLLIAGIAHEINTPLGAIKASSDNLIYLIKNELVNKIAEIDINDLLDSFELYFLNKKSSSIFNNSREERAVVKKIEEELKTNYKHISNTFFYSRKIQELGFENVDPSLNKFLTHKNSLQIFTFAVNLLMIIKSADTISIAINKASKVVSSLNNFSHGNINDEISAFNLKGSIDNVLTLLWNKIKNGSEVINHISDDIYISSNQEELSQVWTNIINNALQASNNNCKIEISYLLDMDNHIITIKNNGPEIPKEIIGQIFDEFFTTKKRGEGTGLGLNIVRKIVEKNKGIIDCFSNSSETKFVISLPIKNE
jgi:signal transduction histidine kinase